MESRYHIHVYVYIYIHIQYTSLCLVAHAQLSSEVDRGADVASSHEASVKRWAQRFFVMTRRQMLVVKRDKAKTKCSIGKVQPRLTPGTKTHSFQPGSGSSSGSVVAAAAAAAVVVVVAVVVDAIYMLVVNGARSLLK